MSTYYVTTQELGGYGGEPVTPAGTRVTRADVEAMGYWCGNGHRWQKLLDRGAVVPEQPTASVPNPTTGVAAPHAESAQTPRPARPAQDLGDKVADLMAQRRGKMPAPESPTLPQPGAPPAGMSRDAFGALVVAKMLRRRGKEEEALAVEREAARL